MESDGGSVSMLLTQLKAGDARAAEEIWHRYFPRLVALRRARLQSGVRRAADEEDVALSAFNSFFKGVERGRFAKLDSRDDLWRLLGTITLRKALRLIRSEKRRKRGGGDVRGDSGVLNKAGADSGAVGWEQVEGAELPPDLSAIVNEECSRLLRSLDDPELQQIALWKMEGDTNPEIAEKLGVALATVERRLARIRRLWSRDG